MKHPCVLWLMLSLVTLSCSGSNRANLPMTGGVQTAEVGEADVRAAAIYAVKARSLKGGKTELLGVIQAERQVVAGCKYLLVLKVKENGVMRLVTAEILSQPWQASRPFQLLSWSNA